MALPLVLITGSNGHVGFSVLLFALKAGYRVRAAVRSQNKANDILQAPSIAGLDTTDKLTFVVVPDLLNPGAYDEATQDVDYVIHVASPTSVRLQPDEYESALIGAAVKGTLAILESAQRSPSVKRVVITSSAVALVSFKDLALVESDAVFNEESRTPDPTGPFASQFEAYCAAKVIAFNATTHWIDKNKPRFGVVNIHPGFVVGKHELASLDTFLDGSNRTVFSQVLGIKTPTPLPSSTVHMDDVAAAHVRALDESIPTGQSLVLDAGTRRLSDALEVVGRRFPEAVQSGLLPCNGLTETKVFNVDASGTERLLGFQFKKVEEQVVSVAEHYLELKAASSG